MAKVISFVESAFVLVMSVCLARNAGAGILPVDADSSDTRQTEFPSTSDRLRNIVSIRHDDGVRVWAESVEELVPRIFTDSHASRWRQNINKSRVVDLSRGCGRMMNRKVLMDDGRVACSRYRTNAASVLGDIYSFVLSRLLGIHNVPPTALSVAHTDPNNATQWSLVADQFEWNGWTHSKHLVSLTEWIHNLQPANIPKLLQQENALPPNLESLSVKELALLAQWTDLIVFDFVTAMRDRLISVLRANHPLALTRTVHNLEMSTQDGSLIFLDNESSFVSGQRYLDSPAPGYLSSHKHFLKKTCIFRRNTVEKFKELHEAGNVGQLLWRKLQESDPLAANLGPLSQHVAAGVQQRISYVYQHMKECAAEQNLYFN